MKGQVSTTFILFVITELLLSLTAGMIIYNTIKDVNTIYEEKFISRDVALLLDSFTTHPVSFLYGFYRYDDATARKAFDDEIKNQPKTAAVVASAYLLTGPYTALPRILLSWGVVHVYLSLLGREVSALQDYDLRLTDFVEVKQKNDVQGEFYQYFEKENRDLETSNMIHFLYEPGRLRVKQQGEVWNPYRKKCPKAKVEVATIAIDSDQENANVAINMKARMAMKRIHALVITDELAKDKPGLVKEQDAYLGFFQGKDAVLRVYYPLDHPQSYAFACNAYNTLTDAFSQYIGGASLIPVHPAQLSPEDPKQLLFQTNPAVMFEIGKNSIFESHVREVARAIA